MPRRRLAGRQLHSGLCASLSVHLLRSAGVAAPGVVHRRRCLELREQQLRRSRCSPPMASPADALQRAAVQRNLPGALRWHAASASGSTRTTCSRIAWRRADLGGWSDVHAAWFQAAESRSACAPWTMRRCSELHKKGWLPLLHFHLQSLQNWGLARPPDARARRRQAVVIIDSPRALRGRSLGRAE